MRTKFALTLFCAISCFGQTPASPAPPNQGQGGGRTPQRGSNEQQGVDVDRFIGYPVNRTAHFSHAGLMTHSILRAGDPYVPGPNGAVLEYYKDLAAATLLPYSKIPLVTLPDSYMFYVKSGKGRLDDGKLSWELRPNIAVLAPPNVPHRLINTSDQPLEMILLTWEGGPNAHKELIVRDVNALAWCEENAHWNNYSRCTFGANDGLLQGERVYLVMVQPFSTSQPHAHTKGTAEIWVKVSPGNGLALLGSELREIPQDAAYLVPPTGTIDHSNINLSKDKPEWWLYIARSPQGGGRGGNVTAAPAPAEPSAPAVAANAGGGGAGRGGAGRGRGPQNPNISRPGDVGDATVPGTPMK